MPDYEQTNAREWDLDYKDTLQQSSSAPWQVITPGGKRPQPKPHTSPKRWQKSGHSPERALDIKRPPPKLIDVSDNEGEAQWRAHDHPKDMVSIPDAVKEDKHYETLAREHSTFIIPMRRDRSTGSTTYGIWGDAAATTATKRAIVAWIQDMIGGSSSRSPRPGRPTTGAAAFAKVVSLTPKQREREERKWEREVTRQKYRQHPPPGDAFGAIGSFLWPVKEYRPEDILGASFEALDPVRMECSCYVVFEADRSVFRVMGKEADVKVGLMRIRRTCFQIAARQIMPVRLCLLRWDEGFGLPESVGLVPYLLPAVQSPQGDAVPPHRLMPLAVGSEEDDENVQNATEQTAESSERLRSTMVKTLRKLHYYKGCIKMRIRFGTFLVTHWKPPKNERYTMDEYSSLIAESAFTGRVTQELGDRRTEQAILPALLRLSNLFTPHDNMIDDLSEVKPEYTAIFTFHDEAGDLRLSVDWQESHDSGAQTSDFRQPAPRWTRLHRDTGAPSTLLNANLTNLATGSAWQFDIQAVQKVDKARLSPQLARFAESLRFDAEAARRQSADRPFVKFNPSTNLKSLQQRISYHYRIALGNSDYTLELSRFQDRVYPSRAAPADPAISSTETTVCEPRWSISVFRTDWDTWFGLNESLGIGAQADWSDDMSAWFPEDLLGSPTSGSAPEKPEEDSGWVQLMEKLTHIEELVRSVEPPDEVEDLLGGMSVG